MVFLYAAPDIRVERVKERAVQRFGDRVVEGGDMYESNLQFLKDNRRYEEDGSPNLKEQMEWMNNLSCIKLELDGTKSIDENIRMIIDTWDKTLTVSKGEDKGLWQRKRR